MKNHRSHQGSLSCLDLSKMFGSVLSVVCCGDNRRSGRSKRALCIKTERERENGGTKSFQLTLKLIVVQIVFFSSIFYINWGIETLGIVINFLKYFLNYYVSVTEISTGNILFVTTWEFVSKTKAKNVRNKWTNYWEPRLAPGHKAPTIYLGFKT